MIATFAAFCISSSSSGRLLSFVPASFILAQSSGKNVDHFLLRSAFHSTPLGVCWPFRWAAPCCSFRSQDIFASPWKGPKYLRFFTSFCAIIQISILHCVINKTQVRWRRLSKGAAGQWEWDRRGREGQLLCHSIRISIIIVNSGILSFAVVWVRALFASWSLSLFMQRIAR